MPVMLHPWYSSSVRCFWNRRVGMFAPVHRVFVFFILFLAACGGGGSGEGHNTSGSDSIPLDGTNLSGIFSGSVVSGVTYHAVLGDWVLEGTTDTAGMFQYFSIDGEVSTVTFSVGNMILGALQPSSVDGQKITVFDLVDTTDPEAETKAINVYRFLRSLDGTDDLDTLEISAGVQAALSGVDEKQLADISPSAFDDALEGIVGALSASGTLRHGVTGLVSREEVDTHIQQTKLQEDVARIESLAMIVGAETLQADGASQVLLRAEVKGFEDAVVQGIRVHFQTTAGTLVLAEEGGRQAVRLTDALGQASVVLTAPLQPTVATVLVRSGGWTATHTIAFSALDPAETQTPPGSQAMTSASIQMAVEASRLFVQGVGKTEQTALTLSVVDGLGNPLNETTSGYAQSANNLRVTLHSRPGGGEMLSGIRRLVGAGSGVDVETVSDSQTITVRTHAGKAVVTLQSCRLPGVVTLKAELLDLDGSTVLATALSSLIMIASGPPHTLVLTRSSQHAIIPMGDFGLGGVYCQTGAVLVTDRHGNAVPNGTPVALGLVDTVIHAGSGSLAKNSAYLTLDTPEDGFDPSFDAATLTVGGVSRKIQMGDRILIPEDVAPSDQSHFVTLLGDAVQLGSDSVYLNATDDPESQEVRYLVGASLRGGAIHGYSEMLSLTCDPANLTTGIATTTGGMAPIRVTYPANKDTILTGCFEDATVDQRHDPPGSAQVLAIASAQDGSTTMIDQGGFCFHAATPTILTANPETLSQRTPLTVTLEDTNAVRLPYVSVTCTSSLSENVSGSMSVAVTPTTGVLTNAEGQAFYYVDISGGGGVSPDRAEVVCTAMDARLSVDVRVP